MIYSCTLCTASGLSLKKTEVSYYMYTSVKHSSASFRFYWCLIMSWHSIDSLSRILPTVRFSMHYRWGTRYTWGKLTFYPGFCRVIFCSRLWEEKFNLQLIRLWATCNRPCGSMSLLSLVTSSVLMVIGQGQLCPLTCAGVKRSFKPYQNEQNSVKDTGEKGKKTCYIHLKISMKILFHYPWSHFPFHLILRS